MKKEFIIPEVAAFELAIEDAIMASGEKIAKTNIFTKAFSDTTTAAEYWTGDDAWI